MKEYPRGGLIGRVAHGLAYIRRLDVPVYAAHAGFFIFLSLFPALVLILSLLRYTGLQVSGLIGLLGNVIPEALMGTVSELVMNTYENSSGALVGVSAVTTLWSASKGIYGLLTGLNRVYGVEEDRGWLYTRFISVAYTFALFLILLLTLALQVFGSTLQGLGHFSGNRFFRILHSVLEMRLIVLPVAQTAVFAALYTFLPNGRNRLKDTLPGAVMASLGWLALSDLFSVYVRRYASLTNVYGSVYAAALSMLWLYLCLSILFYGGALNQYLEDHKM